MFVLFSSLRTPDPYLLLESPRPLSPPRGPQTSYQPTEELTLSLPQSLHPRERGVTHGQIASYL